jgi:hypothetical protein
VDDIFETRPCDMEEQLCDFDVTVGEAKSELELFASDLHLSKRNELLQLFSKITKRQLPWINWDNIRQNTTFNVR